MKLQESKRDEECYPQALSCTLCLQLLQLLSTFYKIITSDNSPKLASWLLLCSPEGPGSNPGISTTEITTFNTFHTYV